MTSLNLNIPQNEFFHMNKQFRAYVAGYRGGKTFVGCVRLCSLALEYPGIRLGYFAPTYPMISDIFYETISDVCELMGMQCEIVESKHIAKLFYCGDLHAVVKCRSMEHPDRIVGFNINHALVDEIDTMKMDKADKAWKRIIARLSSEGFDEHRLYDEELNAELIIEALQENTVDFTTTPEGFNWIYHYFIEEVDSKPEMQRYYGHLNASTKENAKNLPKGYIDTLYATYPANLVDASVDGKSVNLNSGTVYHTFDRHLNHSDEEYIEGEQIHIGMDFNIGRMCAVVNVVRDGLPVAVDEFVDLLDTPAMIKAIKDRYWECIGVDQYVSKCSIFIYPDSTGKNRKSQDASATDISQLKSSGFIVKAKLQNPPVKDRVASMNAMFHNAKDQRRYLVNTKLCKHLTKKLEQQVYDKSGAPEKDGTEDILDAAGYYIFYQYPARKDVVTLTNIRTR